MRIKRRRSASGTHKVEDSGSVSEFLLFTTFILIIPLIALVLVAGCSGQADGKGAQGMQEKKIQYYSCEYDEDCVCKGVHPDMSTCYIGNKEYYDAYVDKDRECPAPDYCSGPEGNLVIRCIANRCMQMPECVMDEECGEGQKCMDNVCRKV